MALLLKLPPVIFTFFMIICAVAQEKSTDEIVAQAWLEEYNIEAERAYYESTEAAWDYNTNITDFNQEKSDNANVVRAKFDLAAAQNASSFDWRSFEDELTKRELQKIAIANTAMLPDDKVRRVSELRSNLKKIYSTGKVCNKPGDTSGKCYPLDPDLTRIMATSRDYDTLEWAWKGWRDATGKHMREQYEEYVDLQNEAALLEGFTDQGDYWRSWYETEGFEKIVADLWEEVKPLYEQLHAYVRRKLMEQYPEEKFPETRQMPAHLLGNMWAQSWDGLEPLVRPYMNKTAIDVTKAMVDQGYDATKMFELSEDFFTSLGLEPMPELFWNKSMIVKPEDREVVCHASAWDFYNKKDFRIKQCTDITSEYLLTTHHEMGHVQYFLQYKDLPVEFRDGANPDITMEYLVTTHHEMGHIQYYLQYKPLPVKFRRGANPGFHEAVGDVMSLSVSTPEHLHKVGLLETVEDDEEADINFLMSQALSKIAFLPFGYLIDQWRWSVFRDETKSTHYNEGWWKLRCNIQGMSPPVTRSESDFDPGAKYHIPGNTPYIRYFVSYILQFQMHEALCEIADGNASLHRCDIYQSKEAGEKLGNMLKLGSSKIWPDALEEVTGTRTMSATSLLKYFEKLHDWLKKENEGHDVTWEENCPEGSIISPTSSATLTSPLSFTVLVFCFLFTLLKGARGI